MATAMMETTNRAVMPPLVSDPPTTFCFPLAG
jgi:hypothetical protein